MPAPLITPEKRQEALARAQAANKDRAAALAEIKAGRLAVTDVLEGREPRLCRTKVRQVLRALPGIGDVTADQLMAKAGVHPVRRVQGLQPVQRSALIAALAALARA